MSASHEYTEWHLTPDGWKEGTCVVDVAGGKCVDPPGDRVLTCCYHEKLPSMYGEMDRWVEEVWKSSDIASTAELLKKYGECPNSL